MRSLLLATSLFFFAGSSLAQQKSTWFFSAQIGYGHAFLNGLQSNYTPYFEGYAKLPMSLAGYENPVLFTELGPAGNASVPFLVEAGGVLSDRFSLSFRYTFYSMLQNGIFYNKGSSNLNGNAMKTAQFLQTTHHAIVIKPAWRFNKLEKKGVWQLYLVGGTTYYRLNNGLRVETEPSSPTAFRGTAEEYLERSDWAFTWGGGLSYTYMFGKHWGATAAAEITTFMLRPDKIERYSYKINGEELVNTLPFREREILLGDALVDDPNNPNIPQALPGENYRYITPQITIGVVYAL